MEGGHSCPPFFSKTSSTRFLGDHAGGLPVGDFQEKGGAIS